jgi:predicted metalloendopeptidase
MRTHKRNIDGNIRKNKNKTIKIKKYHHKPRIQEDFYSHVNYLWVKKESHAKDKDMTMDLIIKKKVNFEMKDVVLERLLEEKTKAGESVRNIYKSSVHWNDDLVENKIKNFIVKLDEYRKTPEKLYDFMGWFVREGFNFPIGWDIEIDAKKTHEYISHLTENGLTFLNKESYFSNNKKYKSLRKSYLAFLKNIFEVVFGKNHEYNINKVLNAEKALAEFLLSYEDVLYIKNTYNPFTQEKCEKELELDWHKFAKGLGFKSVPRDLIIENPKYIKNAMTLLKNWNNEDWKNYWVYQIIIVASKYHKKLFNIYVDFFNKVDKMPSKKTIDLKKIALLNVENYMNTHISKKYIELFKNEKEIAYTQKLISRFTHAFKKRLHENKWLHEDTKKRSLKKLDNMTIVVGYKEKWEPDPDLDYSSVDAWGNYISFNKWSTNRDINLVGKKNNSKNVWIPMEDQNVYDINAYYNSLENELIFPNAILQPPFVDVEKDMAYNLASIGTSIGHEMIHAFDDDGYYYDENGIYIPGGWWHENDTNAYEKKQKLIVTLYEDSAKLDNLKVDGKLTLTENIADIGGFLLTEDVLINYLNEKNIYGARQDKYLKEFYIGYARNWRSNQNIKFFRKKLNEDEHSYSKYRVNCVLSNSKNFQRVFNINPGDKMYFEMEEIW